MRSQSRQRAKPSKQQASAPADKKPVVQAKVEDLSPKKDVASQNNQATDEVFERIAALKKQPTTASSSSKLFHFDPNEPLRIERKPEKQNPGE